MKDEQKNDFLKTLLYGVLIGILLTVYLLCVFKSFGVF